MKRKVNLFIAVSLDGFIAKSDGNIDFLSMVETSNEDYGYADFLKDIDTVILGRKTFEKVLSFEKGVPHKDKSVYVISKSRKENVEHAIFKNDVVSLIKELQSKEGKDIYCDGGGEIVYEVLRHSLIDRMIISIIPHVLGEGIRLFRGGREEQKIKLKRSIIFPTGLVQLWYDVTNENTE